MYYVCRIGDGRAFSWTRPAAEKGRKTSQHWLDRFEKIQHALEDMTRTWWIKGLVESRCETRPELAGHAALVRRKMEDEYQEYMRAFADECVDSRSRLHVSVASLVLATHSCLTPFIRNEQEVVDMIREHSGGKTTPLLEYVVPFRNIDPTDFDTYRMYSFGVDFYYERHLCCTEMRTKPYKEG